MREWSLRFQPLDRANIIPNECCVLVDWVQYNVDKRGTAEGYAVMVELMLRCSEYITGVLKQPGLI